jgi:hypothetical protein
MSNNELNKSFPQYLGKPIQVLWFELDELIIFIFTLTFALIYGGFMWIIFITIQWFYTRTKRKHARGFLKHILYMLGLLEMRNYPEYFEKEFHE